LIDSSKFNSLFAYFAEFYCTTVNRTELLQKYAKYLNCQNIPLAEHILYINTSARRCQGWPMEDGRMAQMQKPNKCKLSL